MVQGEFGAERFSHIAAISDRGIIERAGFDPPELMKADQVADRIRSIIKRHATFEGLIGNVRLATAPFSEFLPTYQPAEMDRIRDFLLRQHSTSVPVTPNPVVSAPAHQPSQPEPRGKASASTAGKSAVPPPVAAVARPGPVPLKPAAPAETYICSHCQSADLHILKGPYSYYFKCYRCKGNTPIDFACPKCRRKAKISKAGGEFSRACGHCGTREVFFVQERE